MSGVDVSQGRDGPKSPVSPSNAEIVAAYFDS